MPSRFWRAAAILAPLVLASLGAAASATAATTSNPSLITSDFACSNGVCEVGPGNVGIAFGAELNGIGGPAYYGPDCRYILSVISGSLPPGPGALPTLARQVRSRPWPVRSAPAVLSCRADTGRLA
jgi:hypothetical protein